MATLLSVLLLLLVGTTAASTSPIGVTYNPPADSQGQQPEQVANRLQSHPAVIRALSYSNISILVPAVAVNRSNAAAWLSGARISAISVSDSLLPATRNVQVALHELGIRRILVSRTAGFQEPAGGLLKPLLDFLQTTNSSFLIYELYRVSPEIPLGFALFQEDPLTRVPYRNLAETGWPCSAGSQPSESEVDANQVYAKMFLRVGSKDGASHVYVYDELFDSHGYVSSPAPPRRKTNLTLLLLCTAAASFCLIESLGGQLSDELQTQSTQSISAIKSTTIWQSFVSQTVHWAFLNCCIAFLFGVAVIQLGRMVRVLGDAAEYKLKGYLGIGPPPPTKKHTE